MEGVSKEFSWRLLMLSYRFANLDDADLYYEWANDAEVRKNSFNCEKIKYEDHLDWFTDKLANKKNLFILFLLSDLPAGQVRIELLENVGKINF